jgi:hypothetical protein
MHIVIVPHTTRTTITIDTRTDDVAAEMAREILSDPQFKADMIALVRRAFTDTTLNQPVTPETK